jgi:hypothetical protein
MVLMIAPRHLLNWLIERRDWRKPNEKVY